VFHDQELHHAGRLTGGDTAKAAALLWSIKEAVVKALGCGFHLVSPRLVHVFPSVGRDKGYMFPVSLSGKAMMRYPLGARRSIWVRSYPLEQMWLSIALVHGQSQ
jgi:phosphopantetheinyl transferase (holo-ACP synthase)